jgi:hypothetical protein
MNAIIKNAALAAILAATFSIAHARPADLVSVNTTSTVATGGSFAQEFEFLTGQSYDPNFAVIYASGQSSLFSDLRIEIFAPGAANPLSHISGSLSGGLRKASFIDSQAVSNLASNTNYKLLVSGFANQAGASFGISGTYIGSIAAVSPVPEPETYAMWLAGLGLLGGIAFRKSRNI